MRAAVNFRSCGQGSPGAVGGASRPGLGRATLAGIPSRRSSARKLPERRADAPSPKQALAPRRFNSGAAAMEKIAHRGAS
jgi:hypothetical protein